MSINTPVFAKGNTAPARDVEAGLNRQKISQLSASIDVALAKGAPKLSDEVLVKVIGHCSTLYKMLPEEGAFGGAFDAYADIVMRFGLTAIETAYKRNLIDNRQAAIHAMTYSFAAAVRYAWAKKSEPQ
jgi:hypothetical protein